jgi:hypothetical protein
VEKSEDLTMSMGINSLGQFSVKLKSGEKTNTTLLEAQKLKGLYAKFLKSGTFKSLLKTTSKDLYTNIIKYEQPFDIDFTITSISIRFQRIKYYLLEKDPSKEHLPLSQITFEGSAENPYTLTEEQVKQRKHQDLIRNDICLAILHALNPPSQPFGVQGTSPKLVKMTKNMPKDSNNNNYSNTVGPSSQMIERIPQFIKQIDQVISIAGKNVLLPYEVPKNLECPITLDPLEDPVQDPAGHVFSRKAIEEVLANNQPCPLCRALLTKEQLFPNRTAKDMVEAFKAKLKIPTMQLFKKEDPAESKFYIDCGDSLQQHSRNEQALENYVNALSYTKDWKAYEKIPTVLAKMNASEPAAVTFQYLAKYQIEAKAFDLAMQTLQKANTSFGNNPQATSPIDTLLKEIDFCKKSNFETKASSNKVKLYRYFQLADQAFSESNLAKLNKYVQKIKSLAEGLNKEQENLIKTYELVLAQPQDNSDSDHEGHEDLLETLDKLTKRLCTYQAEELSQQEIQMNDDHLLDDLPEEFRKSIINRSNEIYQRIANEKKTQVAQIENDQKNNLYPNLDFKEDNNKSILNTIPSAPPMTSDEVTQWSIVDAENLDTNMGTHPQSVVNEITNNILTQHATTESHQEIKQLYPSLDENKGILCPVLDTDKPKLETHQEQKSLLDTEMEHLIQQAYLKLGQEQKRERAKQARKVMNETYNLFYWHFPFIGTSFVDRFEQYLSRSNKLTPQHKDEFMRTIQMLNKHFDKAELYGLQELVLEDNPSKEKLKKIEGFLLKAKERLNSGLNEGEKKVLIDALLRITNIFDPLAFYFKACEQVLSLDGPSQHMICQKHLMLRKS